MKHTLTLICLCIWLGSSGQLENDLSVRTIEVIGEARTEVTPNEIYISFGLRPFQEVGKDYVSPQSLENQIKGAILAAGLDSNVLEATNYYTRQHYNERRLKEGEAETVRFYRLRISDAGEFNEIFSKINPKGLVNVKVERLSNSDLNKICQNLVLEAAANARDNAIKALSVFNAEPGNILKVYIPGRSSYLYDTNFGFGDNFGGDSFGDVVREPDSIGNGFTISTPGASLEVSNDNGPFTLRFKKVEVTLHLRCILAIVNKP